MSEPSDTPRDPTEVLSEINAKTDIIMRLRKQRDGGKFRSVGAALGLQAMENERRKLQAQLPPLRLVS